MDKDIKFDEMELSMRKLTQKAQLEYIRINQKDYNEFEKEYIKEFKKVGKIKGLNDYRDNYIILKEYAKNKKIEYEGMIDLKNKLLKLFEIECKQKSKVCDKLVNHIKNIDNGKVKIIMEDIEEKKKEKKQELEKFKKIKEEIKEKKQALSETMKGM